MLIRNAFDILSGASERIAYLSSQYVEMSGKPIQPKLVQQIIEVTSLYDIIMSFVTLNDDGDAISKVIGENDENLNILLFQLKKAARITSFPEIPNPLNSIVTGAPSVSAELPNGVLGDLFYHNGTRWTVFPMGADGETLTSTPTGLQYQSVVGNGIPSGGSSGQFLIKNSNTSYDTVWASMTLSRVSDVTASVAEVNKLDGALWSTAESNTLVGINTGESIQAQLNGKLTSSLQDGYFNVGNGSGVATAVAPSGDVTFNNLGVFSINAGAIENTDISTSAAIARSKLALGTANRLVVNGATGIMSDAAAITASRALISDANGIPTHSSVTSTTLGYLDATSSIQGQLNQRLTVNLSSPAQGALIFFNGTEWTNLVLGTNGQVLKSNGTTVSWGAATANGIPSGGSTNEYLRKINGTDYNTEWHELVLADVTDVSASAAEVSQLSGWTGTSDQLNYVDISSSLTGLLNNKQTISLPHNAIWRGSAGAVAEAYAAGTEGYVLMVVGGTPTWALPTPPGDVSGVAPSVDNAIARWNGTTADSIQNSVVIIDDSGNVTGVTTLSSGQISVLNQTTLRLYETGSTNYVGIRAAGVMGADYTITLPAAAPASNTYLKYDGADYVWAVAGGGGSALQQRDETDNPYTVVDGDDGYIIHLTGTDPVVIMSNTVTTDIEVTFNHSGTGTVTFQNDGTSVLNTIGGAVTIESVNGAATWVKYGATNWYGWGALGSSGGGGTVTSVSGTANRITSTGGTTPVIDIASTYVGQTSITTLGTIATGVWTGTVVGTTYGGTGLSSIGTANQLIRVNAGATAIEYFTPTFISGNQTITLSGDVTGSGTTAITTTIAGNAVTNTMIRDSAALSVIGNSTNSSGDPADITGAAGQILRVSGTTLAFGSIDLSLSAAVGSSILPIANGGTGSVTFPGWLSASGSILTGANVVTGTTTNTVKFAFANLGSTHTTGAGLWLQNGTAATVSQSQYSPSIVLDGFGWKTNTTASSINVQSRNRLSFVNGAAAPLASWDIGFNVNAAGFTDVFSIKSDLAQVSTFSGAGLQINGGGVSLSSVAPITNTLLFNTSGTITSAGLNINSGNGGVTLGTYLSYTYTPASGSVGATTLRVSTSFAPTAVYTAGTFTSVHVNPTYNVNVGSAHKAILLDLDPTITFVTNVTEYGFIVRRSEALNGIGLGAGVYPTATLHVGGTVKFDLGSDATGDIWYRNSGGNLVRLPIGTTGQVLTVSAGGLPVWV